jgi:hypothetical protein
MNPVIKGVPTKTLIIRNTDNTSGDYLIRLSMERAEDKHRVVDEWASLILADTRCLAVIQNRYLRSPYSICVFGRSWTIHRPSAELKRILYSKRFQRH